MDINEVIAEIGKALEDLHIDADLSDIGNEVSYIAALRADKDKLGWNAEDFICGCKHGISLVDGTHG